MTKPSDVTKQLLAVFEAMTEASTASLGITTRAGQAQWQAMVEGLSALAELPLAGLDEALREIARLRAAAKMMQTQLATFDEQLAALEAAAAPLQKWAHTWRVPTKGGKTQ